jgi:AraC family transcriptional activator FtrA
LRNAYPDIEVDDRCLYRQEGRIFTSAGSAAGIDLMIEIVRQDFGAAAANSVARRLVMPAHRGGGQAQFLERPVAQRPGTGVAPVMEAVAADLRRDWTIASMARAAGMSPRSFQRHFKATTGVGPKEWVTQSRIEAAKTLLTDGHRAIEWVADVIGFANAFSFRRQFRAHVGVTPTEYRSRFFRESKRDL